MSKLIYTETGRTSGFLHEELSQWRHARKLLQLTASAAHVPATLWVFAYAYPGSEEPLRIAINATELAPIAPPKQGGWYWLEVSVDAAVLREGGNVVELWCDSPAMNAWALGIEATHPQPGSFISVDAGQTWRNDAMGAHHAVIGEYLVRLRSHAASLHDDAAPPVTYADPAHPRLVALRETIPADVREESDPWRQLLKLRTFVCAAWEYHGGRMYTPWDPITVLDWGRQNRGHGQQQTVAFCVHFGLTFTAMAASLGHASRCVAISGNLNSHHGHFMSEVWDVARGKWVLHDPTIDGHLEDQQPLSLFELSDMVHEGVDLHGMERTGPAHRPPHDKGMLPTLLQGSVLDLAAVWLRNDFVENPAVAPPCHGHVIYCETDFHWYVPDSQDTPLRQAAMFPYRSADRAVFDAAPAGALAGAAR